MRKAMSLCAALVVVLMADSAMAQLVTTNDGLAVWYDVRATAAEITSPVAPYTVGTSTQVLSMWKKGINIAFVDDVSAGNGGGPGDGQTLFISPRLPTNTNNWWDGLGLHWTGFLKKSGHVVLSDQSVKDIHTYITVESRGGVDEVISALGRDLNLVKQFTPGRGNHIESIAVTMDPGLWNGTATTVTDNLGDQEDWTISTNAVKVPVATGPPPVYDPTGGAVPTGVYHVATTTITAGVWDKGESPSQGTYTGHDSVNNLLITREDSTGSSPPENPDFGYTTVNIGDNNGDGFPEFKTGSNGGIPEAHSGGSGSVIGTTSIEADVTIVIQMKGDFSNSGTVTGFDVAGFNHAAAASANGSIRVRELYLGDFNNLGFVNGADVFLFNRYAADTAFADCSVPADCP